MDNTTKDDIVFDHYVLSMLDALSQKDLLRQMVQLPSTDEEKKEFTKLAQQTCGVVIKLQEVFDMTAVTQEQKMGPPEPPYDNLPPEIVSKMISESDVNVSKQHFSDTLMYYARKNDRSELNFLFHISHILSSSAISFLYALSNGIVLRGAIEEGIGCEIQKGFIYGPILYQAHYLESEIAQYPRVVIGKQLYNHLLFISNSEMQDPIQNATQFYAKMCLKFITTDSDGVPILDYAGPGPAYFAKGLRGLDIKALDFIKSEWERFVRNGNAKLAQRYFWLYSYLNRARTTPNNPKETSA
jgi:hypothetical protein